MAYLVSQYPAASHTFILREILQLRRMGFDVRVASITNPDRPFERLTPGEQAEQSATFYVKNVGITGLLAASTRIFFSRPLAYLRTLIYAFRLASLDMRAMLFNFLYFAEAVVFVDWMRRQNLSHVHIHFSSTVGLLAKRLLPIRASVTIHGSDEFTEPTRFYLREKVETFDLLCAISQYGRSQLMRFSDQRHWNKLRVCRLGVDPAVFVPRPPRQAPSPAEILFVGRIVPVKGAHILLAALDRLVREGRAVVLRFAGDGPHQADLERDVTKRGLKDHVIFEGWQNPAGVFALYQHTDIFALASFAEGIPVVLMEAMAMEIPCVATWVTGIPELIRNDVDGLLVVPSSEEQLAAALARLLDDPQLRERLGKSARKRVLDDFDLNRNTAQLAQIFREFQAKQ
jgi:colanic acid/amylovoran biosynthesis glycosyltransferase